MIYRAAPWSCRALAPAAALLLSGSAVLAGPPPFNDFCSDAQVVATGQFLVNTQGATTDGAPAPGWDGTPGLCGEVGDTQTYGDVWFDHVTACTGLLTVAACNDGQPQTGGAAFDIRISIYDGCACAPKDPLVVCSDDHPACTAGSTLVAVPVAAGQCMKIRVGSSAPGLGGPATLVLACLPAGVCGNSACEPGVGETPCTCTADCGMPHDESLACADGIDNDCTGLTDCADPGCALDPVCACGDGACMNAAGENPCTCSADCGSATLQETPGLDCLDGIDNDCNGLTDCLDPACMTRVGCACGDGDCTFGLGENPCTCPGDCGSATPSEDPAACLDGIDNDCDGFRDCADADCAGVFGCHCGDGACDFANGEDPCTCPADCGPPVGAEDPATCGDGIDNDCDGAVDCDDTDCAGLSSCTCGDGLCAFADGENPCTCPADCGTPSPTETVLTCDDGIDNDCDGDLDCGDADCTATPNCTASVCFAEFPANCQLPNQAPNGGVLAATSDGTFTVADNFTAQSSGQITGLCWWGHYADFGNNGGDCANQSPDLFSVTYFNDDGTPTPADVLAGPFVVGAADSIPTGQVVGGLQEFSFSVHHPPVAVQAGQCYWLAVQNSTAATDSCVWMWSTTPDGDGLSAQDQGTIYHANAYDLSWCLDITVAADGCDTIGSCCLDTTATCNDGVTFADCATQGGRFSADLACAQLDQPCGGGGCCQSDGGCIDVLPAACTGAFHEPGLFCAPAGELLCSAADSCTFDNGPGDLALTAVTSQYDPGVSTAEGADNFEFLGTGDNLCMHRAITFWVRHEGGDAGSGGCFEGTCSLSLLACDTRDATACNSGADGTCVAVNANCSDTPDDYDGIWLTLYPDGTVPGNNTQYYTVDCNVPIPQSTVFGGSADCVDESECAPGELCIDNDGDGDTECAAVCEINVETMGEPPIGDVNVDLLLAHARQGDLIVGLEHVGLSPRVGLLQRPGSTLVHGGGFDENGYLADNFGDPAGGDARLILDDQAGTDINLYDGDGPGIDNYPGPARSGGGARPRVLDSFNGQPRDGLWRLTVTDAFGGARSGTLDAWSLAFSDDTGDPKGPDGTPEYAVVAEVCTIDADCLALGCEAGTTCIANQCSGPSGPCGPSLPTGGHTGNVTHSVLIPPARIAWTPYGAPGDRAYEVTLDLSGLNLDNEKNEKDWLTLAPQVAVNGYYRTTWLKSLNRDGNPAQHIAPSAAQTEWTPADGINDLAFRITGDKTGGPECPNGTAEECCDLDFNTVIDDVCTWCECNPVPVCNVITTFAPADMGGLFGACPPDGFCNVHDKNHALTCFAGTNTCESINIDAGGPFGTCPPDGFCNIHDANHALTCFAGTNTCTCGPAPAAPATPVGASGVTLIASRRDAAAGERFAVRVFLDDALPNLQSYQLHFDVSGGSAGRLTLVDLQFESRADHVFVGRADRFTATNTASRQVLAGLDGGGVPTGRRRYLATAVWEPSADARGTFVIDLARTGQTALIADFVSEVRIDRTTPATARIVSGATRPSTSR